MTPEQEHCERVVQAILADEHDYSENLLEALLRERAAVRAESEKRIAELEASLASEKRVHDMTEHGLASELQFERARPVIERAKYDADVAAAREQGRAEGYEQRSGDFELARTAYLETLTKLGALQSKHQRLVAAARALVAEWRKLSLNNEYEYSEMNSARESQAESCADDLDAALATEPPTVDGPSYCGMVWPCPWRERYEALRAALANEPPTVDWREPAERLLRLVDPTHTNCTHWREELEQARAALRTALERHSHAGSE